MTFRFNTSGRTNPQAAVLIDLAAEGTYPDGKKVQAMYNTVQRGTIVRRVLVYREGTTGSWRSTEGITFKGLPRTPENLLKVVGDAEPTAIIYTMPAI